MYRVMCRVSGGLTGTRESELKDLNGGPKRFATKELAEKEADRLTHKAYTNPYRSADFRYWAEEVAA